VGTPSGVTLAPEGGAHQSIGTPLIGMAQDGLASFEPAFADELAVIMEWAFDYCSATARATRRADLAARRDRRLGLSAPVDRPIEQPGKRAMTTPSAGRRRRRLLAAPAGPELRGGDRLSGRRGAEAIAAAGLIGEGRRDVGVLAVTSADRLNAGWTAAQRAARAATGARAMSSAAGEACRRIARWSR
jgi:pyruvate dehydrogenase E1 component